MAVTTTDVLQSAVTTTDVIKHGTIVCSTSPVLGQVKTIDTYVINTPLHATVETKYTNKHDEVAYYHTASGVDGGGA